MKAKACISPKERAIRAETDKLIQQLEAYIGPLTIYQVQDAYAVTKAMYAKRLPK